MGGGYYRLETIRKPKTKIFIFLLIITLIISIIYINRSRARYEVSHIYEDIVTGTVKNNSSNNDLNIIAIYQEDENGEYEKVTEVPKKGYTLVIDKSEEKYSSCTINGEEDNNIIFDYKKGKLLIDNLTKMGTKCNFYFRKNSLKNIISQVKEGTPDFSKISCLNGTNNSTHNGSNCDEETNGLYKENTNLGTTYYFRGTVNNNWVKYGKTGNVIDEGDNIWWRIIRINEDNTVRLIYAGEGEDAPASAHQVSGQGGYWMSNVKGMNGNSQYQFNTQVLYYNAAVGYMYGTPNSTTFEAEHGYDLIDAKNQSKLNSSNAKQMIDDWYKKNLIDEAEALSGSTGFCGDRSLASGYENKGYGVEKTYYKPYDRLENKEPSYDCPNIRYDLYTTKDEPGEGNGALEYPIGLITTDEASYAGGTNKTNYGYWLRTGQVYWTMSPNREFGINYGKNTVVDHYTVNDYGIITAYNINNASGIRPVINLKSEYLITQEHDGTITNPYEVIY